MNENTSDTSTTADKTASFEQALVNQIAKDFLQEQRRNRRWGIFFKILLALYLFSFLLIYIAGDWDGTSLGGGKHTALIDIDGVISTNATANADYIVSSLRAAYKDKNTEDPEPDR